jgi:ubiquinone/menaquinone biosynthesis C-methylase UbiE
MSFWDLYSYFYSLSLGNLFPYRSLLEDLYNKLDIKQGQSVLDAGCGPGLVIAKILEEDRGREISITGLDINRTMIRHARRKCRNFPNVKLQVADLNKSLEFPDSTFDKVICSNTLYALDEPQAVISEFHRVLKPGGALIIANPKPKAGENTLMKEHVSALNKLTPLHRKIHQILLSLLLIPVHLVVVTINRVIIDKGRKGQYHFLTEKDLQRVLREVGFTNIQTSPCYADQNWLGRAEK